MEIRLLPVDGGRLLRQVKKLYRASFPRFERKPFAMIINNKKKGTAEILAALDAGGNFLGLAIFAFNADLVLLDYFAVSPRLRGNGLGALILGRIQTLFPGKRLFLEIERPGEKDGENSVKCRRKRFYLRAGMSETGLCARVFGVRMELLTYDCRLTFEDYIQLYRAMIGERRAKNVIKEEA